MTRRYYRNEDSDLGPAELLKGQDPLRELDPRSTIPRARVRHPSKLHVYFALRAIDTGQLRAGLRYARLYHLARTAPKVTADLLRVGGGDPDPYVSEKRLEALDVLARAELRVPRECMDVLVTVAGLDEYARGKSRLRLLRRALGALQAHWDGVQGPKAELGL